MPAVVAPEGFQTHQAFITHATPELPRAFEPALVLPAGRFHRAAPQRFSGSLCRRVVHSLPVAFQIVQFGFNGLAFLFAQSLGQGVQVVQIVTQRVRL